MSASAASTSRRSRPKTSISHVPFSPKAHSSKCVGALMPDASSAPPPKAVNMPPDRANFVWA